MATRDTTPPPADSVEDERAFFAHAVQNRIGWVRSTIRLRRVIGAVAYAALFAGTIALWVSLAFPGVPRWPIAMLFGFGIVGAFYKSRRAPTDADIVAYIDGRIHAGESILSAWEATQDPQAINEFDVQTLRAAARHLRNAERLSSRPPAVPPALATLPIGIATLVAALLVPTPRVDAGAGPQTLRIDDVTLLERIERLEELAPDEESESLLADARAEAAALQRALVEGADPREALESMESLREQLERVERRSQHADNEALEEAIAELAEAEPEMAEALRERSLEDLDREVTRAAGRREAADRARAHRALDRAAQAARDAGDEELAESLLRRERLLDRRQEQAELARRLAEAMPELMEGELGRQLERLARDGDGSGIDEATVNAMEEAWSRLTPEERRRLAEAMRQGAAAENRRAAEDSEAGDPMSPDDFERMLRETLANLDDLQESAGAASGGGSIPVPRRGQGGQGAGAGIAAGTGEGAEQGTGQARGGDGQGGAGSGAGGRGGGSGQGPAGGNTPVIEATDGPLARVRPRVNAGAPSRSWIEWGAPGMTEGRAPGADVETGVGVGVSEGGGIGRSRVPLDYEEHVRTYFRGESGRTE